MRLDPVRGDLHAHVFPPPRVTLRLPVVPCAVVDVRPRTRAAPARRSSRSSDRLRGLSRASVVTLIVLTSRIDASSRAQRALLLPRSSKSGDASLRCPSTRPAASPRAGRARTSENPSVRERGAFLLEEPRRRRTRLHLAVASPRYQPSAPGTVRRRPSTAKVPENGVVPHAATRPRPSTAQRAHSPGSYGTPTVASSENVPSDTRSALPDGLGRRSHGSVAPAKVNRTRLRPKRANRGRPRAGTVTRSSDATSSGRARRASTSLTSSGKTRASRRVGQTPSASTENL